MSLSPNTPPPFASQLSCGLLVFVLNLGAVGGASAELLLPAPASQSRVEAVSVRISIVPRPDGLHGATVTLTVANPDATRLDFLLDTNVPEAFRTSLVVTRAGETIRVNEEGLAKVRLEPREVAVLQVSRLVRAKLLPYLPADEAGWFASRGGLLQPLRHLELRHPAGSPFARAAHEVSMDPGGLPLASAVLCTEGALYEAGRLSWSRGMSEDAATFSLTWPVVENETFLPLTREEARAFVTYWRQRRIAEADVRIVRAGIESAHGLILVDAEARRILSKERRPGWASRPGPLPVAERAADDILANFSGSEGPSEPVRVARAQPRKVPTPSAATPEPASPRPTRPSQAAATPTPTREPAPTRVDRSGRQASLVPATPKLTSAQTAAGDDDSLVTRAPDTSWLSETLFRSTASIPDDAAAARRWVRRALRDGHGLSRAVLAREAVPALHGKTWGPGYVSDFFTRQTWYSANADWRTALALTEDEKRAHAILADFVTALLAEPDPTGSSVLPDVPARAHVARVATPPETPAPRPTPTRNSEPPAPGPAPTATTPTLPSGPPLPWLMNTGQARVFLFKEKSRGLDLARLNQAIAVIEARHGKPFSEEPHLRQHFDETSWYQPREDYGKSQLSIPAREVITLLRNAGADPS